MSMSVSILYIASRPFLPASGGRENMIVQSLQFLEAHHSVTVVIFKAKNEVVDSQRYRIRFPLFQFHFFDLPAVPHWIGSWMLTGRLLPLQVAMYLSRRAKRAIRAIVIKEDCQLIIADMLRTSMLFKMKLCVSLLELDDLLSVRYERNMRTRNTERPLGTFETRVPTFLRAIVNACAPVFLNYERWAIERMESESPKRHKAVIFVSHAEATLFRTRTGASNIYSIPPTTKISLAPDRRFPEAQETKNLMFLGNMQTSANREALRFIVDHILPVLRVRGLDFRFYAIGRCPKEVASQYTSADTIFTGFIEDSESLLEKMHIHLAPMFGGTGIKTKVLESLARGIPTITTLDGTMGLDVESGRELFICNNASEIAFCCMKLISDEKLYQSMSKIAAFYTFDQFNFDANRKRYLDIVSACLAQPVEKGSPALEIVQ
jgi:glycosyltransferase involved in cell wall biosynthesis